MSQTLHLTALRSGTPGDLGTVNAIMQEAFDSRYGEAWNSSQCMGMLSLPGVWLTIAEIDGVAGGFALARAILDDGELLLLATRPQYRGRGIGGALLRSVTAECQSRGVVTMHLEVRSGNKAIALYRREGFAQVGTRREYYRGSQGQLFDAHTYSRRLA